MKVRLFARRRKRKFPPLLVLEVDARRPKTYQDMMALINCPECGKQVSTEAQACPSCGYPIAARLEQTSGASSQPSPAAGAQQVLAEVRPSWWGFFWYLFFFFLIIPPIIAYFRRASTVLRIYPRRITLERGLMSKAYQDFNPKDIRSIDIDQGFFQRLVGVGNLTLSTAARVDAAEELRSIPDPKGVRDLILEQRGNQ